jgi:hypothetical protein
MDSNGIKSSLRLNEEHSLEEHHIAVPQALSHKRRFDLELALTERHLIMPMENVAELNIHAISIHQREGDSGAIQIRKETTMTSIRTVI